MASIFGGLIAGGLAGAGAALETSTGDALKARLAMDLEKERSALMLDREKQLAKYRADLEGEDRRAISREVSQYSQPREETLAPDQHGPVGTINPSDDDVSRMGAKAAMRRGRPEIAVQYRAAGEPGKLEVLAKQEEYDAEKQRRAAEAAKELKKTPPGEGPAAAAQARAHGKYYEDLPERERRAVERDRAAADNRAARELLQNSKALNTEAVNLQKAYDTEFGGIPIEKMNPAQQRERAARLAEIRDTRQRARAAEDEGRALLRRGGGGRNGDAAGGSSSMSESDVLARDPVQSEAAPIEGAYLSDNGFWYGPDKTPVITRSGRPVRKSLDDVGDSNMTDAVDRDAAGRRVEPGASSESSGLLGGGPRQKDDFSDAALRERGKQNASKPVFKPATTRDELNTFLNGKAVSGLSRQEAIRLRGSKYWEALTPQEKNVVTRIGG